MNGITLTVSQLNEYVRRSLAADPMLRGICLTGEISNFKAAVSGHWYFTLKDEEAAVNCAMFRTAAMGVRFRPENGKRVRLFGSVGLYAKTGAYQFYGEAMEPDGVGDLYLRFEQLKRKLAGEGLFDASLKKPLPLLPRGIGIVTSKTGAVIHDIARIVWRRYPGMPLYLCPVRVQGDGAAQEIAAGLRLLDRLTTVELIIVGRGGGSMEDLWAFNEECVARAIAACRTPVVSAVGHETDFTIADFAADVRAATPSAAAELAAPQKEELRQNVASLRRDVAMALTQAIGEKRQMLQVAQSRLKAASPAYRQKLLLNRIQLARQRLETALTSQLTSRSHRVQAALLRLRSSGPVETMRRGYAVLTLDGHAVRSAAELQAGSALCIRLADGCADTVVSRVERYEDRS